MSPFFRKVVASLNNVFSRTDQITVYIEFLNHKRNDVIPVPIPNWFQRRFNTETNICGTVQAVRVKEFGLDHKVEEAVYEVKVRGAWYILEPIEHKVSRNNVRVSDFVYKPSGSSRLTVWEPDQHRTAEPPPPIPYNGKDDDGPFRSPSPEAD